MLASTLGMLALSSSWIQPSPPDQVSAFLQDWRLHRFALLRPIVEQMTKHPVIGAMQVARTPHRIFGQGRVPDVEAPGLLRGLVDRLVGGAVLRFRTHDRLRVPGREQPESGRFRERVVDRRCSLADAQAPAVALLHHKKVPGVNGFRKNGSKKEPTVALKVISITKANYTRLFKDKFLKKSDVCIGVYKQYCK